MKKLKEFGKELSNKKFSIEKDVREVYSILNKVKTYVQKVDFKKSDLNLDIKFAIHLNLNILPKKV